MGQHHCPNCRTLPEFPSPRKGLVRRIGRKLPPTRSMRNKRSRFDVRTKARAAPAMLLTGPGARGLRTRRKRGGNDRPRPVRTEDRIMNFASDNIVGASAPVLDALVRANAGALAAYGEDEITGRVAAKFAEVFERACAVFLVTTGTAANALALAA